VARAEKASSGIFNFHTYLAHRLYRKTMVVDEAHLLIGLLQDLASKKLWQHTYHWPNDIRTLGDVLRWVEGLDPAQVKKDKKLKKLQSELLSLQPSTMIYRDTDSWRSKQGQNLLTLIPLDVRGEPPLMWPPRQVQKIVLMSATIGRPDIEIMGLANRKVAYIYGNSPIPVQQRPCDFLPVGNMSYTCQDRTMPAIVTKLLELADNHPGEKGLVHAPYSVMQKLAQSDLGADPRFMFHDKDSKSAVYEDFRASDPEDGAVLMGSGLYEGVDLPYDAGRWQAILKVPFPSLADPAVRAMMERSPEWYAWETAKTVIQAYGRICRTPTDFGATFILDSSFGRLLENHRDLFPKWFTESLTRNRMKLMTGDSDEEEF
jgi:Rad3-related DNA helicase